MNIRSSPPFTRGKKRNTRLICFGLRLACKSQAKEQLKCLFSCSVAQKEEEAPVKQREQGWCSCGSISQSQSWGMKLFCQWLFMYDSAVQYKDVKNYCNSQNIRPTKGFFLSAGCRLCTESPVFTGLYLHLLWIPLSLIWIQQWRKNAFSSVI